MNNNFLVLVYDIRLVYSVSAHRTKFIVYHTCSWYTCGCLFIVIVLYALVLATQAVSASSRCRV